MDKYERFHGREEGSIAIDLHQNFRSRNEVLTLTNDVFYQLMHADIGNVEYDDLAALYPGAIYPGILKSEDFFASEDYDTDFQGEDPDRRPGQ